MKTLKKTQMRTFEGSTIKELEDNFNSTMEWVAGFAKYSEPVVDITTLRGYVIFEEVVKIPEGMRDRCDLAGVRVCCESCVNFEPIKYGAGECKFCKGNIRKGDECCERFFKMWESGKGWFVEGKEEEYSEVIDEFGLKSLRCSA